jgi:propionyl-CoA carboxylase alpha chain
MDCQAYCVGGPASKDSYLQMERIINIAKKTGAQGIHPGYGFLSENAKFVDMVEAAGIAFIGPSSAPMNAMGDKINSKIVAKKAGCFTIPGFEGEVRDEDHAVELANQVGYPVMIKASAGGGGKGMRVSYNDKETREGFRLSKAEALSSFGDDRMLIERFIEDPHHIEIQVIADTHGNVVAFPERECSVQRRNQKVVEESPSCLILPATRRAMQEQAIALCKATNYRSAGTVEMLADGKQNFYFLEMNTRLQVEHPITELVSGEDLVAHMLWVAAGKALPKRLTDAPHRSANGWAIESRVYSEDPLRNFLPSIGPIVTYRQPALNADPNEGPIVRLDTGVFEGGEISMYYDPMIAKLCTHAPTRAEAIDAMENALDNYVVQGLVNNINFLRSVYRNAAFRSGDYGTKFIPEQYPKGFHGVELTSKEVDELVAAAVSLQMSMQQRILSADDYKYNNKSDSESVEFVVSLGARENKQIFDVLVLNEDEGISMEIIPRKDSSKSSTIQIHGFDWVVGQPLAEFTYLDSPKQEISESMAEEDEEEVLQTYSRSIQYEGLSSSGSLMLRHLGSQQEVLVQTPLQYKFSKHMLPPEVKDVSRFLLCPMPGTIVSISELTQIHNLHFPNLLMFISRC